MANTYAQLFIDLDTWEHELEQIRMFINYAENTHDPSDFIEARKKIAGVLNSIESTRAFLEKQQLVDETTAGVESLFSDDQPAMPFDERPEGLGQLDEDTFA